MTTGEKIAALRRAQGLSQEALGEKLGLSRQAVSKWEADQTIPTMDNLVELSRLFGVPVDTLLRQEEPLPTGEPSEAVSSAAQHSENGGTPAASKPGRQARMLVIALALLLAASVMCSVIAVVSVRQLEREVDMLRGQVSALESDRNTVYVSPPEQEEQSPLADYDVAYDLQYNAAAVPAEKLSLDLYARPKELDPQNESALFSIQSGTESWTCAALFGQDNAYTARTEIPMRDGFAVYLVLTNGETGKVRNILLENVSGVRDEYSLQVWATFNNGGISWSAFGGARVIGGVNIEFSTLDDAMRVQPVKVALILRRGETEIERQPVTIDLTAQEMQEVSSFTLYTEVNWSVPDAADGEVSLTVEVVDNYGRTNSYPVE